MNEKKNLFKRILSYSLIRVALVLFLAGIFLPSGISYSRDLVKPELILSLIHI